MSGAAHRATTDRQSLRSPSRPVASRLSSRRFGRRRPPVSLTLSFPYASGKIRTAE
jgi:hypothetical protein